ncbi:MAG: TRAP transporter substrate-binding protein DctP [Desulfobacteraceae bacterium]|nr:TRAP transporter substrate-binding protein DctP [Desulfobacteraceae bacterium]
MKRREFIGKVGLGLVAAGALAPSMALAKEKTVKWKVVTSWPPRMPCLQEGTERIAKNIDIMTNGKWKMQVFAGGELVGPLDVFDAVSQGKAVHAATTGMYYFAGKIPEGQLFAACPYGMTHRELAAWMYQGGGLELYAEHLKPFNMIAFPMASTGTQMGGWFRKEIKSLADLKGLKMRIPGLGGKILARLGVNVVNLPGSEIFTALERGVLDATEWAIPLYDIRAGLFQAAKYYYAPGWHEPTTFVDFIVNLKAWEALPKGLQVMFKTACSDSLNWTIARSDVANGPIMEDLVKNKGVKMRQFPDDVLKALKKVTVEVMEEECNKHPKLKKVYQTQQKFMAQIRPWLHASEWAYVKALDL